jgi:DNA polymerase-3 subunit chi
MTRVDFYQISNARMSVDVLICKLCHKAYQSKQKTLLLARDAEQTRHLDRLLWTHNEESFIPHDQSETEGVDTPILVNHEADPRGDRQLLINLSHEIPIYFAQFERVFELVTEENKSTAREHYSYYKERGYTLNHHNL